MAGDGKVEGGAAEEGGGWRKEVRRVEGRGEEGEGRREEVSREEGGAEEVRR